MVNSFLFYDKLSVCLYPFCHFDMTICILIFSVLLIIAYSRHCLTIWLSYPDCTLRYNHLQQKSVCAITLWSLSPVEIPYTTNSNFNDSFFEIFIRSDENASALNKIRPYSARIISLSCPTFFNLSISEICPVNDFNSFL